MIERFRLSKLEVAALRAYMDQYSLDETLLARAMGNKKERGFGYRVLGRVMAGKEVHPKTITYIREWMKQHCPVETPPAVDRKRAAAGERAE